eukprot:TRINITY_DN104283_c0_g1_i1.p1 TRINITY_DN104283_c0_g1~~TRINITY_DN104283_c0_g1_i1.p1  ORF type:complete len:124 (-),score=19.08 TRINITY_DN104283_c0_g1_i1:120-491(-)
MGSAFSEEEDSSKVGSLACGCPDDSNGKLMVPAGGLLIRTRDGEVTVPAEDVHALCKASSQFGLLMQRSHEEVREDAGPLLVVEHPEWDAATASGFVRLLLGAGTTTTSRGPLQGGRRYGIIG